MGNLKKKRLEITDSGAMSDLAFLLIIFFIVIAVFNVNKGFMLGLPKKNTTKIVNVQDLIKVKIAIDGSLTTKGEVITAKNLELLVSEILISQPNLTFVLKIDPETPYQNVVSIIEIVRKLDVDNFSFSTLGVSGESK